jgi:hypothetical protein
MCLYVIAFTTAVYSYPTSHVPASSKQATVPSGFSMVVIISQAGLLVSHSSRHEAMESGDDGEGSTAYLQSCFLYNIKGVELMLALQVFSLNPTH